MEDFPIRPLRFALEPEQRAQPVWSRSSPEFAMFINALGVDVPHFERFLVKVMRAYRTEINDEALLKDVKGIIGQESHHAFNFSKWTQAMARTYPDLEQIDAETAAYFERVWANKSKKFHIGFVAGYETFTFLGGLIILDRYTELMGDADEVMRAMWVWHQVEEVEHGAVAYDFYRAFYAEEEWYRKYMVCLTFWHIICETFKAFKHMVRIEGVYSSPRRAFRAWRFFCGFGFDLAVSALPVLRRHYHPKDHPICTTDENKIATAWRKRYEAGENSLRLDDAVMTELQAS